MSFISYFEKHTPSPTQLALLLGGSILLYYSIAHGAMPDNLSLGDGIWLLFISAVSGGIIFMGVAVYAGMGFCILDLTRRVILRLAVSENDSRIIKNIRNIFKEHIPPLNGVIYFIAIFWLFICFLLYFTGKSDWIIYLSGALFLWPVIVMLVLMKIKLDGASPAFGFTTEKNECWEIKPRNVQGALLYFVFSVLVYSALLGFFSPVADTTMKILSVRQENVSLYVKSPWSDVLQRHLPASPGCKVPQGYTLFEHVTLSFSNLGNSVSVEIQGQKKATSLKIPGDSVIVDPVGVGTDARDTGCVSSADILPVIAQRL